ncbi:hypothetical protein AVEN_196562-1 [Araneus ventricosus]|uniref:Uncharacterized protein n=1 Tax=Araneus ventricosus TaxID=182803 RepID=A0A4Y2WMJ1_ARAVE|nr:hypothetical protein AVEN_196562-1 [Araneus ventricosus]
MGLPPVLSEPNEIKPVPSPQNVMEYPVSIATATGMSGVWGFSRSGRTVPQEKRESVYLTGGFSSTNSWCPLGKYQRGQLSYVQFC